MLQVFNRMIMLLLSLAALAFGVLVLLLLGGVLTPPQLSPGGVLFAQWHFFTQLRGTDVNAAALVGVVLALVGLLVLILELLPGRREPPRFLVRHDARGQVSVARSSVRDLVQYEAATLPEVMETRQDVKVRRDGLHVLVRSSIAPEADAPQVGQQLQAKLRDSLQRHIGLPVAEVQVATQIEPLDHHTRRRRVR